MTLLIKEVEFIKNKVPNGEELLNQKDWNEIASRLDTLELDIGYIDNDPNNKPLNDIGRFIERLIDKIAYDEGDDDILQITND